VLTIEVIAVHGRPPAAPIAARFTESGGTIGRDASCTLMLPDPERRISRRHAVITCRDNQLFLRSQGVMPITLNGSPLGFDAETPIAQGDRFEIGDFTLQVRAEASDTAPRPEPVRADVRREEDVLAGFAPKSSATTDPFADLIPPPQAVSPKPMAPAAPATGQIPEDFDPFRDFMQPPSPVKSAPTVDAPRDDFSDLIKPPTERIDEMYGLRSGEPFPPDHVLAPSSATSGSGPVGIDDLLAMTPRAPSVPPPAQRDNASVLNEMVRLPVPSAPASEAMPTKAAALPTTAGSPEASVRPPAADGMKVSWDQEGDDGVLDGKTTLVIGRAGPGPERAVPQPPANAAPVSEPSSTPPPAAAASEQEQARLLSALLEGLGLARLPDRQAIDPETMRKIGLLLRAAVQGTIDLLRARTAIKSEVQAKVTMIVARDNNPLKFSPNAEAALAHLLGATQRGFMSPTAAMEDAYRDLVAHQFAFTAGTRAALTDVLRRFDPDSLDKRLADGSMLDSLIPAHRKAKLWELFKERFEKISAEAEDDFQGLFGKEFLRAYDEQVARLAIPSAKDKG